MDQEKNNKKLPLIIGGAVLGTIAATIFVTEVIIPTITAKTSTWGTAELAIVISLVAILAQVAPPFIEDALDKKNQKSREIVEGILQKQTETYYSIKLDVSVLEEGNVQFEATIHNEGFEVILPRYTRLYIDQGMEGSAAICEYKFPFILEHKVHGGGNDCILCTRCKNEGGSNYPTDAIEEPFKSKMEAHILECGCFPMDHLSEKSIKYIRTHEQFQENIILNFKKSGVYRATLVVITHNADCQCATEQFYVKIPSQPQIQ